jgi:hypothetical protein
MRKIKGFKGFDKDLKCKDVQFEVGKEFSIPDEMPIKICASGFHLCKNPLDIFRYYKAGSSRFAEVEGDGDEKIHEDDSKIAVRRIFIKAEIKIDDIIKGGIKFIFEKIKEIKPEQYASGNSSTGAASGNYSTGAASGNSSTGAASGYSSTGAASGNYSTGAASGYYSTGAASGNSSTGAASGNYSTGAASGESSTGAASGNSSTGAASGYSSTGAASGESSTGAASGYYSTGAASGESSTGAASGNSSTGAASGYSSTGAASGNYSTAIVTGKDSIAVANGKDSKAKGAIGCYLVLSEYKDGNLIDVKCKKVDGKKIKADTFYTLQDGKFVVVK